MTTFLDLLSRTRAWAEPKGILDTADPSKQALYLFAEAGELADAILKQNEAERRDAIGDVMVVLANLATIAGDDILECWDDALAEIEQRTGKTVDGVFVKDDPLPSWAVPWHTLPSEAKFQALDEDGCLFWYEGIPKWSNHGDWMPGYGDWNIAKKGQVQGTMEHIIERPES